MMKGPDPQKSKRAMEAMMQMKKIDIAAMRRAAEQG
jgi:predicted 3-demethylubiquinone-9 3-methyltransferase (glyoxalase superfamily)